MKPRICNMGRLGDRRGCGRSSDSRFRINDSRLPESIDRKEKNASQCNWQLWYLINRFDILSLSPLKSFPLIHRFFRVSRIMVCVKRKGLGGCMKTLVVVVAFLISFSVSAETRLGQVEQARTCFYVTLERGVGIVAISGQPIIPCPPDMEFIPARLYSQSSRGCVYEVPTYRGSVRVSAPCPKD